MMVIDMARGVCTPPDNGGLMLQDIASDEGLSACSQVARYASRCRLYAC